jgi:TRAP transporter TAXI family solute receptor
MRRNVLEERMINHRRGAALLFALISAFAVSHGASAQDRISITTGGTGGVYYPLGGGMANILSKNVPGLQATAEVTGGSVDNLKLIGAGKSEVGFTMVDAAHDAAQGEDKFKGGKIDARTLMVLYPNRMQVVTVEGTGINSMADLKGKRISTGSAGSGVEVMSLRVLDAMGLDPKKDIKQERLGAAESVNAIKDRKIDAFFWVGGVPTAAVTDLAATPGIKIKLIDHADVVDAMNKKYGPLYVKSVIPAGSYPGQDKPNAEVDVWNILVTNDKMSDQMAYTIVKTLFEKKAEIVAVHGEAKNIDLKSQALGSPIPFHPGAKKYLEEQGVKVN